MIKRTAGAIALVLAAAIPLHAATYIVSTTSDSGAGSLRQAIIDANANPGPDSILFNILQENSYTPPTILLASPLPVVTESVTIDASTQQAGRANISAKSIFAGSCLELAGSGSVLKRLTIRSFDVAITLGGTGGHTVSAGMQTYNDAVGIIVRSSNNAVAIATTAIRGVVVEGDNNAIDADSGGATVGVEVTGSNNTVTYTGRTDQTGIAVWGNHATSNRLTVNSAVSVTQPIDLSVASCCDGPTANDALDADSNGGNLLQNYPTFTAFGYAPGAQNQPVRFVGSLSSKPNTSYSISIYGNELRNLSGLQPNAQRYVATTFQVITDANGYAPFDTTVNNGNTLDSWTYRAVATDPDGNTSEFSPMVSENTFNNIIYWRNTASGNNRYWLINSTIESRSMVFEPDQNWQIAGQYKYDVIWRNTATGEVRVWYGSSPIGQAALPAATLSWDLVSVNDFNLDGHFDLLWRNPSTGENIVWVMQGQSLVRAYYVPLAYNTWRLVGSGDLNNDLVPDLVWQHVTSGALVAWRIDRDGNFVSGADLGTANPEWRASAVGDYNKDGGADIVFRNVNNGQNVIWYFNSSAQHIGSSELPPDSDASWKIVAPK